MTPFFVIAPFGAITNLSEMLQTGKNDFFFVIAPFGAITKSLGLSIDNETAIMFLRMKVKPVYNDKNTVQNHVQALEQLYPDISSKINDEQRKKLFKFLEAMLELV